MLLDRQQEGITGEVAHAQRFNRLMSTETRVIAGLLGNLGNFRD
jgi:hypothetical protein